LSLVLVPHNMRSNAARDLANTLSEKVGHKVWRVTPDRVRRRIPFVLHGGTDKLTQLRRFNEANVDTLVFTDDRGTALSWFPGATVVCRTVLRGSQGAGIVLAETPDQVVQAPLYTQYFKKKKEFRVHVLHDRVIDVQEKRARSGYDGERDVRIRNLANGYVFCRDGVVEPTGLRELAIKATASLGYSLGAVDIAYNEHLGRLAVLEVNANPGMQGTTLENYATAIVAWYKEQQ
jgi:glutathione synthase/RimK-type ligase-like ATP-grasp enzyme